MYNIETLNAIVEAMSRINDAAYERIIACGKDHNGRDVMRARYQNINYAYDMYDKALTEMFFM